MAESVVMPAALEQTNGFCSRHQRFCHCIARCEKCLEAFRITFAAALVAEISALEDNCSPAQISQQPGQLQTCRHWIEELSRSALTDSKNSETIC